MVSHSWPTVIISYFMTTLRHSEFRWLEVNALSWRACEKCNDKFMEPLPWRSRVCVGERRHLSWMDTFSDYETRSMPCNSCLDCEGCESCNISLAMFRDHRGKENRNLLFQVVDSQGVSFLAKISRRRPLGIHGVRQIVHDCMITHIIPQGWYGTLRGSTAFSTKPLTIDASSVAFSELRHGVWVPFSPEVGLEDEDLVSAMFFDFLVSHSARHPHNVLLETKKKKMILIDNDASVFRGEVQSIFVPGSPMGYSWWETLPVGWNDRLLRLSSQPLPLPQRECLQQIVSTSCSEIEEVYKLDFKEACALRERAKRLLVDFRDAIIQKHCTLYRWNGSVFHSFVQKNPRHKQRFAAVTAIVEKEWQMFSEYCKSLGN